MFEFVVSASADCSGGALAIAASRAEAAGVIDLQFAAHSDGVLDLLRRVSTISRGRWGVHVDDERQLDTILTANLTGLELVICSAPDGYRLTRLVERARQAEVSTFVAATSLDQGMAAEAAGADAVIAKGHEAGGWIGDEGSFVLLQRLLAALRIPVWVHGGIGLHTVAAAYAAGAKGALLDGQVLLAKESELPLELRDAIAAMDGSETRTFGTETGAAIRVYARPGLKLVDELREAEVRHAKPGESLDAWGEEVRRLVGFGPLDERLVPLGQDAAFAADLAHRFGNVAGIIRGLRDAIYESCRALHAGNPLREAAPLAQLHGTRYPIVQGPMTRVSDRAEFAAAVSEAGALPLLALALMRAPEADRLLQRTQELLGERPWGVGVLGFVPPELRAEQLEVVRAYRPPFALIAGGRPDQARQLEDDGITTYLHVPSPGLLKLYLADGARRFVFEGRECGGHVGPRTSFVLWDTMLRVLLDELPAAASEYSVLFAGGLHDARSAAMVAAAAATAAERGIGVGLLLGTAYLFTREATEFGAITPRFQQAALAAADTVLLESGPGHATRCLRSPFVEQFEAEKRRLQADGVGSEETRGRLEQLNVGRLRIAAKGADHNPAYDAGADVPKLVDVEPGDQWERGMYMIGQVAALRDRVTTLGDLHHEVSDGSGELLAGLAPPDISEPVAPAPPDVAIIGLGCILPGAPDISTFWSNILDKVDAITEVPEERWDWRRMYDPDPAARDKVYSRWGGFIDPVPFEPLAIGAPPRSLTSIEPFQLLALITAQAALRDAGYEHRPFDRDRTSVILGAGGGGADLAVGYTVRSALPTLLDGAAPELERDLYESLPEWTEDSFAGLLMNVAAGRVANRLDLGGTNYTVDAACASSLNAIGLGARELQVGTSEMVLAGGVDAIQNPFAYLCFSKTYALSPNGRCRPFDAAADGIAISEGFATVVLKRLADAERDGDRIYAVIRGVGCASDGRDRSLTAPRPEGQMRALRRAYTQAGFSASTVGLVEAHGTGTVAGDGAEVQALTKVFAEHGAARQSCAIGSVKSMIGHTKATAGVAGVIKTALALHNRVLPPTIGVEEPNPKASFPTSPFYVNSEARPWLSATADHPRRAAVSAFGFGGTDFHIVLEEYTGDYLQSQDAVVERWPAELLLWRGTREEIAGAVDLLAAKLASDAQPRLCDLAKTLAAQADVPAGDRTRGVATLAVVVESLDDLRTKLSEARELLDGQETRRHTPNGVHFSDRPLRAQGSVAFLFPGQGSQVVDMAREVAIAFPEAREAFERADQVLADCYDSPLSHFVFPPPSFTQEEERRRQAELTDTHVAQPALGAAELAYMRVLAELGVEPQMTAGHSYGEFVALAAAGVLDQGRLFELSEARGRLMREAAAGESGAMAAVDAPPDALAPALSDGAVVAANLNTPNQTVLSGPQDRIEDALAWCQAQGIRARLLPVACAFHSPHVAGAQRRFAELLDRTPISPPEMPVYSNTTGEAHPPNGQAIAQTLGEHLVRPVEFVREIEAMHRNGAQIFLEVGPRAVLTGLIDQILEGREYLAVPVDRPGRAGLVQLLHCLGALAAEGVPVRTERLFRGRRARHIDLQTIGPDGSAGVLPPGAWLVSGGRCWPADLAAGPAQPSHRTPREEERHLTTTNGSGIAPSAPMPEPTSTPSPAGARPAPTPGPTSTPSPAGARPAPTTAIVPAAAPSTATPSPDRTADVMAHYQLLMQQFLETQRDVMLRYLGGSAETAVPRSATAIPATRTLPAPPPAALPPPAPMAAPAAEARAVPVEAVSDPVPAAPVARAASAAPPTNGQPQLTGEEIQHRLLDVVSERTGYPPELLGLDADLESDLGVDSIKRVEIAGTFTQTLDPAARASIDVEKLTASRTLREVIAALEDALSVGAATGSPAAGAEDHAAGPPTVAAGPAAADQAAAQSAAEARPFEIGPADPERIGRFLVHPVSAPAITARGHLARRGAVVIVDDETGVGDAVSRSLAAQGEPVVRVAASSAPDDAEGAAELTSWVQHEYGCCKALVHLAALGSSLQYGGIVTLLALAQAMREDLEAAAAAGGAVVLGAIRLGGAFGGGEAGGPPNAPAGAVAGFLKTLAYEWPTVRVKAVDLAEAPPEQQAEQLLAELLAADGLTELGYRYGERTRLALRRVPAADRPSAEPIGSDSVVLITGGARGITAKAALALARRYRPTLVLVGRTEPQEEGPQTAALTDLPDLRQAIMEARRTAGKELTPALIEGDCRQILRAREVRENLERIRAVGARVEHMICDVSDRGQFARLIDDVYERHGRIDGVVHGAGVIEDRLVRDKQRESLERVMATKAGAAQTLADHLRSEDLRFLVLFSSVSGRFGNRGQADYAAASEVLARLAHQLDARWPGRVVAIDWGPWRTEGMVSPELEREFERRGVALIEPERGCQLLIEELNPGIKGEAEVVIGAATGLSRTEASVEPERVPLLGGLPQASPDGVLELLRSFTLEHDRYLDSHRVDGRPVLPFAVAMELMAELVVLSTSGRELAGLRDIRLFNGISVDDEAGTTVAIRATPDPSGTAIEVVISAPDDRRPHYRALVNLRDANAPALQEPAAPSPLMSPGPYPTSVEEAYRDLLFHGPLFHGITELSAIDEGGSSATLTPSDPGRCVAGADGIQWLLDPVLIDSALQVQVLWARLQWDVTLLPAEIGSYARFGVPGQDESVRHELRIRAGSTSPFCRADHWFYGSDGRLLATLGDVVGVGTRALNRLAEAHA